MNKAVTQNKPINLEALIKEAKTCKEKEAYIQLEKTAIYRIGVGARADSSDSPSFFLELVLKLSQENSELDLPRLEKNLAFLKTLQTRGYAITYQDNNSVLCEIKSSNQEIYLEYTTVKTLAETQLNYADKL